ncbi:hypothetical protein AB0K35_25780 [Micromonospora sp. NPDC053740]|uniref:hypothetical protein n=1 Tax=Micromonospora sp. NPDC053740 TaxID=3155173 RepID=UPI0034376B5F
MTYLGIKQLPAKIAWTPLKHRCGCVADWGWDSEAIPPPQFIAWCINVVGENCPWHGGETEQDMPIPANETIALTHPGSGASIYVRKATGSDVALGEQLAADLQGLMEKATNNKLALVGEIPPRYRKWLYANGYDPLEAWLDQRLTDIVLNRGEVTVTPEMLNQVP